MKHIISKVLRSQLSECDTKCQSIHIKTTDSKFYLHRKLTWIEVKQWAALIARDTSTEPKLYKLNEQSKVKHQENFFTHNEGRRKVLKLYVFSSSEYIRSSYITWCAEIGWRVGEVAAPRSCWTRVCNPGSASMLGSTHATQAAKNLPQGEKWAPISLQMHMQPREVIM